MIHDVSWDKASFYLLTVCLAATGFCAVRVDVKQLKNSSAAAWEAATNHMIRCKYWKSFLTANIGFIFNQFCFSLSSFYLLLIFLFWRKAKLMVEVKNQSSSINNNARFFHQYISLLLFFSFFRRVTWRICFVLFILSIQYSRRPQ